MFTIDKDISNLNQPILPYVQVLALYIRRYTNYTIEISSLRNDNGDNKFFQIDEADNKFYFSFFHDKLEFAIDNFDAYTSISWDKIFRSHNNETIEVIENLGADTSLIKAYRKFLSFCHQKI